MIRCVHIVVLSSLFAASLQQSGKQLAPCVWQNEDGSVIDVNSLGFTNGSARWADKPSITPESDTHLYSLNPCHEFTRELECQDVTACRVSNLGQSEQDIGDPTTANMYYSLEESNVVLEYSHGTNPTYISRFILGCSHESEEDQVVVIGIASSTPTSVVHRFLIYSPIACPNETAHSSIGPPLQSTGPPTVTHVPIKTNTPPHIVTKASVAPITTGPPKTPHKISAGGIICIIFVVSVSAYFLLGAIYMFFCSGARGVEIIPHVHFWQDLPNLILDGLYFLIGGCSKTTVVSTPGPDYDKI